MALARGDRPGARARLEALVGRELMGRTAERAEAWAHAELGWVLAADGQLEVRRQREGRSQCSTMQVPHVVLSLHPDESLGLQPQEPQLVTRKH